MSAKWREIILAQSHAIRLPATIRFIAGLENRACCATDERYLFMHNTSHRSFLQNATAFLAAFFLVGGAVARADQGITPLMEAIAAGDMDGTANLLKNGAAPDISDARGRTAAWHAVNSRQPAALAMVLEKARETPGRCALGRGTLDRAFQLGDWSLIEPVLAASRDSLGWNTAARRAIARAINERNAAQVRAITAKFWRQPLMEGSRHPILAHAILNGDTEAAAFLLDCGLDPNTRIGNLADREFANRIPQKFIRYYLLNDRGATVLMLAAGMQRTAIAKLLIDRGARAATCTLRHKMAALSFAAEANDHETMRVLIAGSPSPLELRVEISLSSQTATLYKKGEAIETTTVSTGVEGKETRTGKFLITNKSPMHFSNIYKGAKMPFFMRLNCSDFGMHQGIVTGAPASHGCIRLPGTVAKKWFAQLPVGTEVSIY
jgi:lipoprotein-anchoring transpeptidase ErfK/SrfK